MTTTEAKALAEVSHLCPYLLPKKRSFALCLIFLCFLVTLGILFSRILELDKRKKSRNDSDVFAHSDLMASAPETRLSPTVAQTKWEDSNFDDDKRLQYDGVGMPSERVGMPSERVGMLSEGMGMSSEGVEMLSEGMGMPSEGVEMPSEGVGMPSEADAFYGDANNGNRDTHLLPKETLLVMKKGQTSAKHFERKELRKINDNNKIHILPQEQQQEQEEQEQVQKINNNVHLLPQETLLVMNAKKSGSPTKKRGVIHVPRNTPVPETETSVLSQSLPEREWEYPMYDLPDKNPTERTAEKTRHNKSINDYKNYYY